MIRKKNRYARPKKAYEKSRIIEEDTLVKVYGLKNKKEIWKALAKVKYFRRRAMALAKAPLEEQEILFTKLKAIGLKTNTTADVLALKLEDLLERRLQTIVFKRNLANTPKHARQMVTHKKISINGSIVNKPSYIVSVDSENTIKLVNPEVKKVKKEKVSEEKPVEVVSNG
jgi:small subunit ribosomal protein S4